MMYAGVHMTLTVNITDFRQNIFKYADLVRLAGYEFEVEKEGSEVFYVSKPKKNDAKARAVRLARAVKAAAGKFPDFDYDGEFFRGKKEIEYMRNLGKW